MGLTNTSRVVVVAGNPRPGSRTLAAGQLLAEQIAGRPADDVLDIVTLGDRVLAWGDEAVTSAVHRVASAQLLVVASPTFKGTYSGILKMFLDHIDSNVGLAGVTAVSLMLGSRVDHALAGEVHLRPLLSDLGASIPAPSLFLVDDRWSDDPALDQYVMRWASTLVASASSPQTQNY